MHIPIRRTSRHRSYALHKWVRGVGNDGRRGRHEMGDEGVDEVEDEGGVEEDGGDEVGC